MLECLRVCLLLVSVLGCLVTAALRIESPHDFAILDSSVMRLQLRCTEVPSRFTICISEAADPACLGFDDSGNAAVRVKMDLFQKLRQGHYTQRCFEWNASYVDLTFAYPAVCLHLRVELKASVDGALLGSDRVYFRVRFHDTESASLVRSAMEMLSETALLKGALSAALADHAPFQEYGIRILEFGAGATTEQIGRLLPILSERPVTLHSFDCLTGLPADWKHLKAGSMTLDADFLDRVSRMDNVVLHTGLFEDALANFLVPRRIRFVLIDVCLHSSAQTVLEHLVCSFDQGTAIVFANFFNMREWKEVGEFPAWDSIAKRYAISYSVEAWFATWVHLKVLEKPRRGCTAHVEL